MSKKKTEDFKELQEELDSVKELSIQFENQLKRAVADYHNLEKRVAEGRSELTKWGTSELLIKLLPTLDHLEQALAGANETERQSGWFKGVELAVKEFMQVLQSEGLDQIAADPVTSHGTGSQFDPNLHEAVDTQVGEDNKILKVVRKGYSLNGKVLRPAAVVVGRRHSGEEQSDDSRIQQEDSGQARMTEGEQ